MNCFESVRVALKYQKPGKILCDLGGNTGTTITNNAYFRT